MSDSQLLTSGHKMEFANRSDVRHQGSANLHPLMILWDVLVLIWDKDRSLALYRNVPVRRRHARASYGQLLHRVP